MVKYRLIKTQKSLQKALDKLMTKRILAVDIETTGLDPFLAEISLLQITAKGLPVYIIQSILLNDRSTNLLSQLFSSGKELVFHNGKFDLKFLLNAGFKFECTYFDTMLAEQVIDSGRSYKGFSLKDVTSDYLGIELDKTMQTSDWRGSLSEKQLAYAARDVEVLLKLRHSMKKVLKAEGLWKTARLEFEAVYPTALIELNGIYLDRGKLLQLSDTYTLRVEEVKKEIFKIVPKPFNLNSPMQIVKAFNALGIPLHGASKEALAEFRDYPIVQLILEYKKAAKLEGQMKKLVNYIHPLTKRIHANYNQCSTATGRYSCSKPNLQGIPKNKEFRECFVPEEGNSYVVADYSQIELRIIAEVTSDKNMLETFNDPEGDLHKLTASIVNDKDLSDVTPDERGFAKAFNFGLAYGMGYGGFAKYAYMNYGLSLSIDEVRAKVNQFFSSYSGLAGRLADLKNSYRTETRTIGGRRRNWDSPPPLTELANSDIQGTGADIIKKAIILATGPLEQLEAKIVAIIHDEIVVEVPTRNRNKAKKVLRQSMEKAGRFYIKNVPIIAEAKTCKTWADK